MPDITTDDAEAIADKLTRDAPTEVGHQRFRIEVKEGRGHRIVKVWYGGRRIGQYGIQRASACKRHNYVAGQLHLSRKQAYDLAKCPLTVDGYITILEEKREI
jgi:hypothetical protein